MGKDDINITKVI